MQIISLIKMSKGRTKICLDNGTDFCLYKAELEHYKIKLDGDLSINAYEEIVRDILLPRCKKRALHLLEKQDRSRRNLSSKLSEGGYPDEVIKATLDYIDDFGYLDDARMASSYIRFYQESRSRGRITQDLLNKGIDMDTIERCLEEEYQSDESDLIKELMKKRNYDPDMASYEEKAKMYRFLASRGFKSDSINKALRS